MPTLGYWKIRGLGEMVRLVLEVLEQPYENVYYEQGEGPEFSREEWMSVKFTLGLDFPNLPYLQHGDFQMTETIPIMKYLCELVFVICCVDVASLLAVQLRCFCTLGLLYI